jgi:hypothetical protein
MDIVELAIGHYHSNGEPLPKHRIEAMELLGLSTFAQLFGGGQLHHRTGSHLSTQGQLIIEPCTLIKAYASNVEHCWTQLMAEASRMAAALDQESVLLTRMRLEGMLYWAKPVGKLHQLTQLQ